MSEDKARKLTGFLLDEFMKVTVTFIPGLLELDNVYGRCWCTSVGAVIEYDPEYLSRDLVAHECAHALTPGCEHNKEWKREYRHCLAVLLVNGL